MSIPLLLAVSFTTFLLQSLAPGDTAYAILGANATPERYAALRTELGLDLPVWQQYVDYLVGILQGTLGISVLSGQPVVELLNERLPVTLSLVLGSAVISAVVGTALGTLSALRRGALGKVVDVVSMAGLAVPNFWLGLVLVTIFAVGLGLFPAIGYVPFAETPGGWVNSLVLPWVALSLSGVGLISKNARDAMSEVLGRDFVRSLRANGASEASVVWRHGLRNSGATLITVLSLVVMAGLTGSVFVETVFSLPGLGSLATSATLTNDIPVVQGVALYFTIIVIFINLLVDISYGLLNPKVRVA